MLGLKSFNVCILVLILFMLYSAGTVFAPAQLYGEEIDPALQKIVTYKFSESRETLSVVSDMVKASLSDPGKRAGLERQFISFLASNATFECKDFICRQLWIMGSKESVPVLSQMLLDEKLSDMARYALQQNPCPEAGDALVKALGKAQGKTLIGIINSIGERREVKSVNKLAKYLYSPDPAVASAAASSLGMIGGDSSLKVLEKARTKVDATVHRPVSQALLYIADGFMQSGKKEEAAQIYRSLCSLEEPKQIRKSSLYGLEQYLLQGNK